MKCAKSDCHREATEGYPYCSLSCKIRDTRAMGAARDRDFEALWTKASAAGMAAGAAVKPQGMAVMAGKQLVEEVPEGPFGFAWVVTPGNIPFVNWMKREAKAGRQKSPAKNYYGGMIVLWVSAFGQSYDRKVACAEAFAKTLIDAGIDAHVESRLD
jgi:hypothetical protein